jgi:hypothetical protein
MVFPPFEPRTVQWISLAPDWLGHHWPLGKLDAVRSTLTTVMTALGRSTTDCPCHATGVLVRRMRAAFRQLARGSSYMGSGTASLAFRAIDDCFRNVQHAVRSTSHCSSACGPPSLPDKKESAMKLTTIVLASAFVVSGTFAFAQGGNPNGTAGGPTSLSGTGPSTSGGDTPGAVGSSGPAAGGSMSGGTTGSAAGNQPCDNPNGCPGGPTSLSGTGSSQYGGSSPGSQGKN